MAIRMNTQRVPSAHMPTPTALPMIANRMVTSMLTMGMGVGRLMIIILESRAVR